MKKKYNFTPEMDQMIIQTYREVQPVSGHEPVIRRLAQRFNLPPWQVSIRARDIGASEPKLKESNWTQVEIGLLEKNAHKHPQTIRKIFTEMGYKRSISAIITKRKRLKLPKSLDGQNIRQLAECFGIAPHIVVNWIKTGRLKAEMRGTERTAQQGGDIYYIRNKDIRKFIKENIGIIDIRKVDKFWFTDICID